MKTKNQKKPGRALRIILGVLLAFGALNAFGGGYYGMSGAEGVPLEWLDGSPFDNYFIPGLFLFVIIGGSFLTASIVVFSGHWISKFFAITSVVIVYIWLAVQLSIIGYISWMQPATAIFGVIVLVLAWFLPCVLKRD
ncbi:MAG: hypothetical protein A2X18_13740 [Bacteroidetes bacterium GWF2_40_14]|nr:MAG: hypothetical protein A2X18_13740 [Bacteroidetes bacterium GWF2_40_14]